MAISTVEPQDQVQIIEEPLKNDNEIGITDIDNNNKNGKSSGGRRRRRRRRSKDSGSVTSDSSSSSSSSDSNNSQPQRSRRNRRRTKNGKQNNNNKKIEEIPLTAEEQAQYIAMDCEMVGVGPYGNTSSVARVTLVGWNGETILDEYVKQEQEVTDYRTFVSGITQHDLDHKAVMSLKEIRERVQDMIQGKILVGHALKNDKKALRITHPWYLTRDTAKYEPFMYVRFEQDGILWPRKLKDLAKEKCGKDIQVQGKPHSAYEDALAAMDLYKLVRRKWEKAMDYKKSKTLKIEQQKQE